jgi:hypothetical protein
MQTQPRPLAQFLLGSFAILVAGAIALSLATAPADAQQQLRIAASATINATGFVLTDTNSAARVFPGCRRCRASRRQTMVVHVVYNAPDRVMESELDAFGRPVSAIVIGSTSYGQSDGIWRALPSSAGLGSTLVGTVLFPLEVAADATSVTRLGDTYQFQPADVASFVKTILGIPVSQLTSLRAIADVRGDYVSHERITAIAGRERLVVDLVFSAIGSAPVVEAPRVS